MGTFCTISQALAKMFSLSSRTSPGFDLGEEAVYASLAERVADKAVWAPPRERTRSFSGLLKEEDAGQGQGLLHLPGILGPLPDNNHSKWGKGVPGSGRPGT